MDTIAVLNKIMRERQRSIEIHGHWFNYSIEQMMNVIIHELMVEAGEAEQRVDIHGEHGLINELVQVASCCVKAIEVLSGREVAG